MNGEEPTYHVQITSDSGEHGELELPVQLSTQPEYDEHGGELRKINPQRLTPATRRLFRDLVGAYMILVLALIFAFHASTNEQARKAAVLSRALIVAEHKAATARVAQARCSAWDEVHFSNLVAFQPYSTAGLTGAGIQVRENFNKIVAERLVLLNEKLGPRPSC